MNGPKVTQWYMTKVRNQIQVYLKQRLMLLTINLHGLPLSSSPVPFFQIGTGAGSATYYSLDQWNLLNGVKFSSKALLHLSLDSLSILGGKNHQHPGLGNPF